MSITSTNFYGKGVVLNRIDVSIADTKFKDIRNADSALTLRGSNVYFKGCTTFENNMGINGGAISLLFFVAHSTGLRLQSTLHFHTNSRVYIVNNSASYMGGGIYVEEDMILASLASYPKPCFYQLEGWNEFGNLRDFNATVILDSNTAVVAGSSIYGGMDTLCSLFIAGKGHRTVSSVFDTLFQIKNTMSSSELASHAQHICICSPISIDTSMLIY